MRLNSLLSLDDFEVAAKAHLPAPLFGYIAGAAETNQSRQQNRDAFAGRDFLPRVLRNVSQRQQSVELLGRQYSSPFGIAPMGMAALLGFRGDIALASAARDANIPMIVSGSSLIPLETIAREGGAHWFQAYLPGEAERILALIERVDRAGYETLVITVDVPIGGNRENNIRAGFSTPLKPSLDLAWQGVTHPKWLIWTAIRTLIRHGMPHFENSYATRGAPILSRHLARDFSNRDHLNWQHLAMIRERWRGKLVVKGILHVDDAKEACAAGVDGIIVSNHGGRQLDGAVSPLKVLKRIVDASGPVPVMMDGGIRRGSDVLKALALGASMVFVGRPFMYAAAIGETDGVQHAVSILKTEVDRNMALLGLTKLTGMSPDILA
jgi:L-lactate dehydrogenase (cytochrome)